MNDPLIFPDLTNYKLLKETSTDYIYLNNDTISYLNQNNFVNNTTEDFIYQNLPGTSVWSTRQLMPVDLNVADYSQQNTSINTTFRGDLELAVYAEGNLNINFTKQRP